MSPDIRTLNPGDVSPRDPKGFFVRLDAHEREAVSLVVRSIEAEATQRYQEAYVSPRSERVRHLSMTGGFERQTDAVSCVYFSTANALRILDRVEPLLSVQGLKSALRYKNGTEPGAIGDMFAIKDLIEEDPNYSRFTFKIGDTQDPRGEFDQLLEDLASGKVVLWNTHFSPDLLFGKDVNFSHVRLITGFKINVGKIIFSIVDPYDARAIDWTMQEVISGALYTGIKMGHPIDRGSIDRFSSNLTRVSKKAPPITTINPGIVA